MPRAPADVRRGPGRQAACAQAASGVATHIGPRFVSTISGTTAYATRRPWSSQTKVCPGLALRSRGQRSLS